VTSADVGSLVLVLAASTAGAILSRVHHRLVLPTVAIQGSQPLAEEVDRRLAVARSARPPLAPPGLGVLAESGESYEPEPFRRRTGGVGTVQLQNVWPRSQRYSRYRPNVRELPVGDAGAWQTVQRRPRVFMCAPYSRRPRARRAIQVALRTNASTGRSE
jgi:hypothetical protein